ncbi:hypothetical protein [Sphingomonas sp. UV9]|uniref:hypothetical protein n=1 Tax=Sphingomonas sp. UV9 TaxID=1851410 RepID=UPI0013E8D0C0|nr:hypothetical protein [Sphingomonas sp. UV9]
MIAVAPAMVVRISFVAIGRDFVGIAGGMTLRDLLAGRLDSADARIRSLQRVRRRRPPKGEDEHQAGKDVQQASHVQHDSKSVGVRIAVPSGQASMTIIAKLPALPA